MIRLKSKSLLLGFVLFSLVGIGLTFHHGIALASPSPTQEVPSTAIQTAGYETPGPTAFDNNSPLSIVFTGQDFSSNNAFVDTQLNGPNSTSNGVNTYVLSNQAVEVDLYGVNPDQCTVGMSITVADNNLGQ